MQGADLARINPQFSILTVCNTNDDICDLEDLFSKKMSPIFSDIAMDDVLFARIKSVYDSYDDRNCVALSAPQLMLLDQTYKSRVRSGALLEGDDKARFKEINTRLSQLSTTFGQNMIKHKATFEWIVSKDDLAGVPERAINAFKSGAEAAIKLAEEKGDSDRVDALKDRYLVTLSPSSGAIMTHCENRALRKILQEAGGRVGAEGEYDNRPLVLEIVALRHEQANILGYENYAQFVLEDRMAGTPEVVNSFLQDNLDAYKPAAEVYFNDVKAFAMNSGEIDDFEPYDFGFYSRQLKESVLDFDDELLRPYFEVSKVMEGVFQHAEKLFNVKMVDVSDKYPAYRDDASCL